MIVWARHAYAAAGAPFCAVSAVADSVLTACGGRWQPHEGDQIRWNVPAGERCGGCVREIERPEQDDASDPTWVGEGPRLAKERLARRAHHLEAPAPAPATGPCGACDPTFGCSGDCEATAQAPAVPLPIDGDELVAALEGARVAREDAEREVPLSARFADARARMTARGIVYEAAALIAEDQDEEPPAPVAGTIAAAFEDLLDLPRNVTDVTEGRG